MARRFATTAALGIVAAATLATGATATNAPSADGPVAVTSMVTSLTTVQPDDSASQLLGQWRSDAGDAVLFLQEDGTYGYALGGRVFSTAEKGYYQVNGPQLTLTPITRTGIDSNGNKLNMGLGALNMSIGSDPSGNLVLDFNGSIYHKG